MRKIGNAFHIFVISGMPKQMRAMVHTAHTHADDVHTEHEDLLAHDMVCVSCSFADAVAIDGTCAAGAAAAE